MQQTIIVMIFLGLVLIGVAIYLIKKEEKERQNLNVKLDEAFSSINEALDSFEEQTSDFNKTCELIFREIEEKYQELLYLYGLIDEKQSESPQDTENTESNSVDDKSKNKSKKEKNKKKADNSFIYKNKNAQEIFRLHDEGMSVTDIAKTLSIGKGEVQLMLNIRKA